MGYEWRRMCKKMGICHQYTTPYRPQSNGRVERANRSIKELLGCLSNNNLSRWTEVLPEVIKIMNTVPSRATNYTPLSTVWLRATLRDF
jgi:transposase InsO family protein